MTASEPDTTPMKSFAARTTRLAPSMAMRTRRTATEDMACNLVTGADLVNFA